MAGVRGVSQVWLLFPALIAGLLGGACRRASHCPEGWEAEPVGKPVQGYWCRTPKADRSQYVQVHPQSGRRRQVCNYTAGKPDGDFAAFHPDGQRWIEGRYADGRLEGTWTQWDERGNMTVVGDYRQGILVSGAPVGIAAVCAGISSPGGTGAGGAPVKGK